MFFEILSGIDVPLNSQYRLSRHTGQTLSKSSKGRGVSFSSFVRRLWWHFSTSLFVLIPFYYSSVNHSYPMAG